MPAPHTWTAWAKLNLTLHVTGKQSDGYHLLDSYIAFTDFGDTLSWEPQDAFSFHIEGPFAHLIEKETTDNNLVVRAAKGLAALCNKPLTGQITLHKNIPVGAGLGGGSADAACILRGLQKIWAQKPDTHAIKDLCDSLGSDVWACYESKTARMRGTGSLLDQAPPPPPLFVLLVYPCVPCETRAVYRSLSLPEKPDLTDTVLSLEEGRNDLYDSACSLVPDIGQVLDALRTTNPFAARMTGSGSACFALYQQEEDCRRASEEITSHHPDWWVQKTLFLDRD